MKSVLITGGSGGIGGNTALAFARRGYFVGVNYFSDEKSAAEIARKTSGVAVKFDVTDFGQVEKGIADFVKKSGRLDALVLNAGVCIPIKPILDVSEEEFDKVFSVNVKGVFNCVKAALPYMLERGGSVVVVSSMWGLSGGSCEAVYSASKSAVIGMTKALAKEYSSANIRINAVAPGLIDTKMNDVIDKKDLAVAIDEIPLGRAGKAEEVAEGIFYLADTATFTTGEVLNISGGEII
ncbi:MAG: SDR family oxidoreductase [Clostridia bacterium]|nr:SDR family oxidoreductase [Clostridia bacterium]